MSDLFNSTLRAMDALGGGRENQKKSTAAPRFPAGPRSGSSGIKSLLEAMDRVGGGVGEPETAGLQGGSQGVADELPDVLFDTPMRIPEGFPEQLPPEFQKDIVDAFNAKAPPPPGDLIGPRERGVLERLADMIRRGAIGRGLEGTPIGKLTGLETDVTAAYRPPVGDEPILNLAELTDRPKTPTQASVKGLLEVGGGLTSPKMVTVLTSMGVASGAAPLLGKLISAGFSVDMLLGAYEQIPEFREAFDSGDELEAVRVFTHIAAGGYLGAKAGQHALSGVRLPISASSTMANPVFGIRNAVRDVEVKPETAPNPAFGISNAVRDLEVEFSPETASNPAFRVANRIRDFEGKDIDRSGPVVEELPATVDAQLDSLKGGTVPAVYLPRGSRYQPETPRGMERVEVSEGPGAGSYIYDPEQVSAQSIRDAAREGQHGRLLGHVQTKAEAAAGGPTVVQARRGGVPVQDSVVSADRAGEQSDVLQQRHPGSEVREVSPGDVISDRLEGKPIYEMSAAELKAAEAVDKTSSDATLTRLFGAEGAARYKNLERASNSTIDTQRADRAFSELQRMEESLSQAQRDELFGVGEKASTHEDFREYRVALEKVEGDTPKELGASMRFAISDIGKPGNPATMSRSQQLAYAQLRHGFELARGRGWDLNEVYAAALRSSSERFSPEDARAVLRNFIRRGPDEGFEPAEAVRPRQPESDVFDATAPDPRGERGDSLRIGQRGFPFPRPILGPPPAPRSAKPKALPLPRPRSSAESGFLSREVITGEVRQVDTETPRLRQVRKMREAAEPTMTKRFVNRLRSLPTDFVRRFYNRFIDIEKAVQEVERNIGRKLPAEKNPVVVNDLVYGGTGGVIEAMGLDYGDVMRAADKQGLGIAVENIVELKGYRRAIQVIQEKAVRAVNEGRKQEAKEFTRRVVDKKVVPAKYGLDEIGDDLKAIKEQLGPERFKEAERLAGEIFRLNRQAWDLAQKEGLISKEVWRQGVRRGDEYIPLERVIDIAEDSKARIRSRLSVRQQQILKTIEGSERVNKDPLEVSIERHAEVIREAARNEAARTLLNLRNVDPNGFGKLVVELKPGEKAPAEMDILGFYENGEKRLFALPKPLADAMEIANSNELGIVQNVVLRISRRVFSATATTANLGFSIPNAFRDFQDFASLSKGGARGPVDTVRLMGVWAKSLHDVIREDPTYREFLRSRAAFSTMQKNIEPADFIKSPAVKETVLQRFNLPGRVIRTIEGFNNALEETTKLASFKRLKQQGFSDTEAAFETRRYGGSPDFARKGTDSQSLNLLFMFFNAQVQGVGRTFGRLAKDPKRLSAILGTATAMELALFGWNSQFYDENGTPEWSKIPQWEKSTYFVIIRPETYQTSRGNIRHRSWKIPKGYAGRIIFSPIETAIEKAMGWGADVTDTVLDVLSDLSPISGLHLKQGDIPGSIGRGVVSSLNPAIREPVEQFANLDTFRDRPIVPRSLEDALPEEQRFDDTSPSASALARLLGISPLRVEHVVEGFFTGLGEQGLSILDSAWRDTGGRMPLEGDEELARTHVLGPIIRRFVGSPMDQQVRDAEENYYGKLDKLRETIRTVNILAEKDVKRAADFVAGDPERLVLFRNRREYQRTARELSKLGRLMREVARSKKLSDEDKKGSMRMLFELRVELLRKASAVDELARREREKRKKKAGQAGPMPRPVAAPRSKPAPALPSAFVKFKQDLGSDIQDIEAATTP